LGFDFPQADMQDQTLGGPQAIWRNDVAAVRSAAARYGSAPLLLGKMQRGEGGWNAEWTLLDGGSVLHRWNSIDPNASAVLAAGADGTASTLARSYVADILSGPAGEYEVTIVGLAAAEDYGRLLQYLQALPIVQSVQVGAAEGDRLQLKLGLRAGIEGLTRLIQRGGVLRPGPGDSDGARVFYLER
jgi:hypothetical protein